MRAVSHLRDLGDGGLVEDGTAFELLRSWAEFMAVSGTSPATLGQYKRTIIRFIADTLLDLRRVTEADVVAYLGSLQAKGSVVTQTLRALRSFYGWAEERELIWPNPVRRLRSPRPKYGPAPYLSEAELEKVIEAASNHRDPRLRPVIEFMFATGARIGSMCGLQVVDLDFDKEMVTFRVAKGDDPYTVPLGERGMRASLRLVSLQDYSPRTGTRRDNLIGFGPGRLSQLLAEIEIECGFKFHAHLLRHSFAERIANDPAIPDLVAAALLNHRDTSLLRRYAHPRESLMRQAVAGL